MRACRPSAVLVLFGCAAQPVVDAQPPSPAAPSPQRSAPSAGERAFAPRPDPSNAPPRYPEAARRRGIEATVAVKLKIDREGRVAGMEVLWIEPSGDALPNGQPFVDAVRAAVRGWKFVPARLTSGEAISVWHRVTFPFRLR
jgi:periplasmic protein TonB